MLNTQPFNRNKSTNQTTPHIFLGYPNYVNGYLCFNPITTKMLISRDVIFMEDDFSENSRLYSELNADEYDQLQDGSPKSHPLGLIQNSSAQSTIQTTQPINSLTVKQRTCLLQNGRTRCLNLNQRTQWSQDFKLEYDDPIHDMPSRCPLRHYHRMMQRLKHHRNGIVR